MGSHQITVSIIFNEQIFYKYQLILIQQSLTLVERSLQCKCMKYSNITISIHPIVVDFKPMLQTSIANRLLVR